MKALESRHRWTLIQVIGVRAVQCFLLWHCFFAFVVTVQMYIKLALACSRLRDSQVREIEKVRTQK